MGDWVKHSSKVAIDCYKLFSRKVKLFLNSIHNFFVYVKILTIFISFSASIIHNTHSFLIITFFYLIYLDWNPITLFKCCPGNNDWKLIFTAIKKPCLNKAEKCFARLMNAF